MFKKAVTAGSFALGAAGMILVGYLQADPLAFTRPVAEHSDAIDLATITIEGQAPVTDAVVVSEVVIAESRRGAKALVVASREPCGSWNEVGALYVAPGGATGVRSVRTLCP
jgi:hypothetical protein